MYQRTLIWLWQAQKERETKTKPVVHLRLELKMVCSRAAFSKVCSKKYSLTLCSWKKSQWSKQFGNYCVQIPTPAPTRFLGGLSCVLRYGLHITSCGRKCLTHLTKHFSNLSDIYPFLMLLHIMSINVCGSSILVSIRKFVTCFFTGMPRAFLSLCILT